MAYPAKTNPEAIKAAAIELLEQEGEAALTIRRVAATLGVAPNAFYRHYATCEALVAAVADEAARRLVARIDEALARQTDATAQERVAILADVYLQYMHAHPALYQASMTHKAQAQAILLGPSGHAQLWARAVEVLSPLAGAEQAPSAAVTLWALLHGIWSLDRANLFGGKKPGDVNSYAVKLLLKGLT